MVGFGLTQCSQSDILHSFQQHNKNISSRIWSDQLTATYYQDHRIFVVEEYDRYLLSQSPHQSIFLVLGCSWL